MTARASLVAVAVAAALAAGCRDNPFGRPATFADGSGFPPALRGSIAPARAYAGGAPVDLYLLGDAPAVVADAVEVAGPPPCDGVDETGAFDLDACQGPLLPALPDAPDYTPFVRLRVATAGADYPPNGARAPDELADFDLVPAGGGSVADLAIVDAEASVADPAGRIPRRVGWVDGIAVVYLELAGDLPVDAGGAVAPMDLLVPAGWSARSGAAVASARAGEPGYSTRCRVVYFAVPDDFQAGDVTDAADIPEADRTVPEPEEYVHCAVP